ncbi:O-antigen ligase [Maribacter vaceletii]|uniref:O-antigen ligase n=1 Tax=Maribacter vaceletii TaxID=1206816 RepID=A0A495DTE6_9FLAO|nr:O-antigen ligase family protein [Maribacter vaceletii]RKR07172.1 O-antigen ligase [Maribacter vaceletii]
MIDTLKKINNIFLYILVFSTTFEYWDPFHMASTISIAYISTILYFFSSIPFLKTNINLLKLKRFIWPLILFVIAGVISTSFNPKYVSGISDLINLRVVQLIILMVLIAGHVSSNKKVLKNVLWVYVFSILTISILNPIFGIGDIHKHGRLFIFGENPNLTGMKSCIAFLIVTANLVNQKFKLSKIIYSVLIGLPILNLLILSGSRGGLLSLVVGLFIMAILVKVNIIKKGMFFIVGFCFSIYLFNYIISNDQDFSKRITLSINKGDTAGRGHLWVSAYQIIEDNFIFGVGTPGLLPEMRKYSGTAIEPHNVFLYVLVTTGIMGFVFFMTFILRLISSLFKEFKQTKNALNMVIFMVIIMNMSKSGGSIGIIFVWIFFALLIGSIIVTNENKINCNIINK